MSVSVGVWGGGGCLMSLHIHLTSVSPSPPPGRRERARDDRGKRKPQRTQRRRGDTHQRGEDQSHQQTEGHKTLIIPRSNRVATNHLKKKRGKSLTVDTAKEPPRNRLELSNKTNSSSNRTAKNLCKTFQLWQSRHR